METRTQRGQDETVWPPPPAGVPLDLRRLPLTKMEVFWQIVRQMTVMGLTRGALCGAGFGVFFYVVGALSGVIIGGAAGLLLGGATGFILAFATCRSFYPLQNAGTYRRFVGSVSAAVAFVPGLAAIIASFKNTDDAFFLLLLVLLPSLIAVPAAWMASQRLAGWYELETLKQR